jgi:hypothetical protein
LRTLQQLRGGDKSDDEDELDLLNEQEATHADLAIDALEGLSKEEKI